MKYTRFKELWDEAGFTFDSSPELAKALIAMADEDEGDFNKVITFLFKLDNEESSIPLDEKP